MVDHLEIPVTKGEVKLNLKLPKSLGFDYRVVKRADQELMVESVILTEANAAKRTLGTTISTSVEGRFEVEDNGELFKDTQANTQPLEWIVVDFHKERLINEIELTIGSSGQKVSDFVLKIWGGTIFFSSSPLVRDTFTANSSSTQTIVTRFAEQLTEKALIEFGSFQNDKFTAGGSVTVKKLGIKAFGFPANVSLRIGDQAPFFTHPGELASGVLVAIPDFSKEINTYLENNVAEEIGDNQLIPLILTSESEGIVSFKLLKNGRIEPIDADITHFGFGLEGILTRFSEDAEMTSSVEQASLDFDGPSSRLIYFALPRRAAITEATFQIQGSLSKERLLLENIKDTQRLGALGSDDFLLAQSLRFDAETDLAAVTLLLEFLTDEVDLSVAIHSDFKNQPANSPLPESEVPFQFPLTGQIENINTPTLLRLELPAAIRLNPGQYWIVLTTTKGQITWRINEVQPNMGGFVFTRLDGAINWMVRRHPTSRQAVSGSFLVHSLAQDTSDLIRIGIGNVEGFVGGIETPQQIDRQVTSLMVNGKEKKLVDLLNDVLINAPIPVVFSTSARGSLEVSNLKIKFTE